MRLRYKLMATTLLFTFVLTVSLSLVFLSEILRERVSQTAASNDVLLHQVLATTRSALTNGLQQHPPDAPGEVALAAAVAQAVQSDKPLAATLEEAVRYSPSLQDAFVTDGTGRVLISTDPALADSPKPSRRDFTAASRSSPLQMRALLFGEPETLDVTLPLNRNGKPFLAAHLGIRSTFLRNAYAPWLRDAALVCIAALIGSLLVAALLSAAALRPIEQISRRLDVISHREGAPQQPQAGDPDDAVERVTSTLTLLDERIRTSEQTQTEMATNLNGVLQTLRDGIMLFTADLRIAMVSDAAANFLPGNVAPAIGTSLAEVFPRSSAIGTLLADLVAEHRSVRAFPIALDSGRMVEVSLDHFPGDNLGAMLTLHDVAAQEELEREIEVSRRLAGIGRLTAGVGHEVKNPINAMVVHLELLRNKLTSANPEGAQRHVEVLASEMSRLDRVVQTLADFSRPLDPHLKEQPLLPIIQAVVQLVSAEADKSNVALAVTEDSPDSVCIVADAELLRQALLNIVLNAMQAMPGGGVVHINLSRDRGTAVLSVRDTGTGIPADKLDNIFDLYFTTKQTGSGIGLSMTYRILQLHGGAIDVTSNVDPAAPTHGTTFTLRLPVASRTSHTHKVAVA